MLKRRIRNDHKPFLSTEQLYKIQKHLLGALGSVFDPAKRMGFLQRLSYINGELLNRRKGKDPLVEPLTEKQAELSKFFME